MGQLHDIRRNALHAAQQEGYISGQQGDDPSDYDPVSFIERLNASRRGLSRNPQGPLHLSPHELLSHHQFGFDRAVELRENMGYSPSVQEYPTSDVVRDLSSLAEDAPHHWGPNA